MKLHWSSPFPRSFVEFIKVWPYNINKGIYNKLWNICPSIIVWEIWKERNRRIFNNTELNVEDLTLKIEASIVETTNSFLRKSRFEEGSFSIWDGIIKKTWTSLINPPLVYFKKNKEGDYIVV